MATTMIKLATLAVLCMVIVAPYASEAAITCRTVSKSVSPCVVYVRGTGPLSGRCFSEVVALNKAASNTPDRQQVCKCLKELANDIPGIIPANLETLPKKCRVNITYRSAPPPTVPPSNEVKWQASHVFFNGIIMENK